MRLSLLPPVEKDERLVELCRTTAGKVLLLVVFALLMPLYHPRAVSSYVQYRVGYEVVALVAATTFLPRWRRPIIALAGGVLLFTRAPFGFVGLERWAAAHAAVLPSWYRLPALAAALAFCAAYATVVTRFADARLLRRPVFLLFALFTAAVCAVAYAPFAFAVRAWCWAFLCALGPLLWFLAYTIHDRKSRVRLPLPIQLGHYTPFWGSTFVPYPKSTAHLSKIEVKDDKELAIWQLKGLKLICWAIMLSIGSACFSLATLGGDVALGALHVHIPAIPPLDAVLGGAPASRPMRWIILFKGLIEHAFSLAIFGHVMVGIARFVGFKALRGTYRPFESISIAEFFNRYNYYFKELLVDFFFYPTYTRHFKGHPKLRSFVAIFAAACIGNIVYHYLRDMEYLVALGPVRAAIAFSPYALYAFLLGIAVGVSQWRGRRQLTSFWRRRLANAWVITFFAVMLVFDDPDRTLGLRPFLRYIVSLFIPLGAS